MYILLNDIFVIIFQYYIINFAYYWYHWVLHQPWSGILYEKHYICHHKKDYPLKELRKFEYTEKNGGDIIFGIPISLFLFLSYYYFSFRYFIYSFLNFIFIAIPGEILHTSYHLYDNAISHPNIPIYLHRYITKLPHYNYLRNMHDLHHAKKNTNFGFIDFQMDKLFGTYTEDIPKYLKRHQDNLEQINNNN